MRKIISIVILAGIGVSLWYVLSLRPVSTDDTRILVRIPSGSSVAAIGQMLEEKGLIRSAQAFSFYARIHAAQSALQAGDFSLRANMDVPEIMQALRKGFSEEVTITIPEGFTVSDIDALLAKKGLLEVGAFQKCAQECDLLGFSFLPTGAALAKRGGKVEGYLFPDTYFVLHEGFTAEKFLIRLLGAFRKRVIEGLADDLKASKHSLHEIVTMASLIEEETRTNEERPVVAGILWKRFDQKIGLGVDATNRYILEKPTAALTKNDLDVDSAYNLRKYRGLPPGPIANPGLASISAALHPQVSPYWYYLHGKDGMIRYAKTNEEHNGNKALYLR